MAKERYNPALDTLAKQRALYPQESPLKVKSDAQSLSIGIPKEKQLQEKRLCLTPESVGILVSNGHEVKVESLAGKEAHYDDHSYSEHGATIVYSEKEVFEADLVLKVEPPSLEEIEMMNSGASLISAIQMSHLQKEYLMALQKKKITSVAFELIEDKGGLKPVVQAMSEIASSCIISIAGEYLSNSTDGMGVVLGAVTGVPPIRVVVLGAGTIGENVTRVLRHLGAEVRVFDNHHYKLRRLKKNIGEQVYTSVIDNYTLMDDITKADVVIGALRSEEGRSPCVVSEEMVTNMKKGAIIIDASISQGGCFETSRLTTHDNPVYLKHDIIHYCVPNIPSRVSRTATRALSYIFTPMLNQIAKTGGIDDMIHAKEWFMNGVYTYKGNVTSKHIAEKFGLSYKDLSLLLAASF